MTWSYRIVRRNTDRGDFGFGIHEAYYNEDGSCYAITQDEIGVWSETLEGLKETWIMLAEAFAKPVLDYETREEIS